MADLPPAVQPSTSGDDWPAQAADTIVKVVGTVRDRTTGTAIRTSRGVVYGLLAGVLGITAVVLVSILAIRCLDIIVNTALSAFDADRPGRAVWIVDGFIGMLLVIGGALLWKKANATPAD